MLFKTNNNVDVVFDNNIMIGANENGNPLLLFWYRE